jgi:hypothetical protein
MDDLKVRFEEEGAVMLRGVIPLEDLDELARQFDLFRVRYSAVHEALDRCPARVSGGVEAAVSELLETHEWLLKVQLATGVRQALHQIFNDEPVGRRSHFVYHSPGVFLQNRSPLETVHNHSFCLQSDPPGKLIMAWVPVDDVDSTAGPMWIVPGSHKEFADFTSYLLGENPDLLAGVKKFWSEGATGEEWQAWFQRADELSKPIFREFLSKTNKTLEPVLLKKGDILLFSSELLHGTLVAQNPTIPRRAVISIYQAANCELWEVGDGAGRYKNPHGPGFYKFRSWTRTPFGLTDPTSNYRHYASMKGWLH